jgi:hypothetical protein
VSEECPCARVFIKTEGQLQVGVLKIGAKIGNFGLQLGVEFLERTRGFIKRREGSRQQLWIGCGGYDFVLTVSNLPSTGQIWHTS